jgi:hypothetical protein
LILTGLLFISLQNRQNIPTSTKQNQNFKKNSKLSVLLIIVGFLSLLSGASTANKGTLYIGWFVVWGVLAYEARKSQKMGRSRAWLIIELPSLLLLTLSFVAIIFKPEFCYEHPLPLVIVLTFYVVYIRLWMKNRGHEKIAKDSQGS